HGTHRADHARLVGSAQLLQHRGDLVVRALVERCEGLAAFCCDRDETLPAVIRRTLFREQSLLAETLQYSAEISVVEIEICCQPARRHRLAMRKLIKHARLGERESRVHQAFLQQPKLARVEAGKSS